MTDLTINGKDVTLDVPGDTPLLWALRDDLRLTGTKFGCGVAQCGACTVMVDGMPMRSCVTPVEALEGSDVVTIQALEGPEAALAAILPPTGRCAPMIRAAPPTRKPRRVGEDVVMDQASSILAALWIALRMRT